MLQVSKCNVNVFMPNKIIKNESLVIFYDTSTSDYLNSYSKIWFSYENLNLDALVVFTLNKYGTYPSGLLT